MEKLLCLDLDGTLLRSDKTISKETSTYLKKISKIGIKSVIITGRHYDFAKYLTKDLGQDKYIAANNGAGIFDEKNDQTIIKNYIDDSISRSVIKLAMENKFETMAYVNVLEKGFDLYSNRPNYEEYMGSIVRSKASIRKLTSPTSLNDVLSVVIKAQRHELEKLESIIASRYDDEVNYHILGSKYQPVCLLEIMDKRANKWIAVKELASRLGIEKDNIISFGDEINDLEMVRNSGLGFAMKNSIDLLKSYAKATTKYTNDEDGVIRTLKELIDSGKYDL